MSKPLLKRIYQYCITNTFVLVHRDIERHRASEAYEEEGRRRAEEIMNGDLRTFGRLGGRRISFNRSSRMKKLREVVSLGEHHFDFGHDFVGGYG